MFYWNNMELKSHLMHFFLAGGASLFSFDALDGDEQCSLSMKEKLAAISSLLFKVCHILTTPNA